MNFECVLKRIFRLFILLHILTDPINLSSSASHYGHRKGRGTLRRELASVRSEARRAYHHYHPHRKWSGKHKPIAHFFTPWSAWSPCDTSCKKHRERYCRVKRKCGHAQHVEVQKCWGCHQHFHHHHYEKDHHPHSLEYKDSKYTEQSPKSNVENHIHPVVFKESYRESRHFHEPYETYETPKHHNKYINDDEDDDGDEDFYIIKKRKTKSHKKKKKRPIYIEEDYDSENDFPRKYKTKNYRPSRDFETEYTEPNEYESEEMEVYLPSIQRNDYEGYWNSETGNLTRAVVQVPPKQRRLYTKWSKWSKCTPKCTTRRFKKCRAKEICGKEVLREIAYCYTEGSFCQQWLQAQIEKSQTYDIRPSNTRRNDFIENENSLHQSTSSGITSSNSNVNSHTNTNDFIMNGRGYRGQEYEPMKLKCGIAPALRNNRRNMNNLLKIIGGKASRKGEWPWQVAIFNRYKEAFCGGTLIAPQWILTAAHCLRKVLYVRLGEHNLDFEDGSELQFRVLRSYKHPSFDRKTVDSDIALLKLPRPVNTTTYIGFSCLPRSYQPLPKNIECTVIGWGKRRNTDQSGTSILHQAEVPLIPMDNCRSVYHDYTITKNMFCAGHRRGRIDTCAGDSGGPLLCRDSTKPNHPWTIFGITSFGDGCAKRNKFGIYAKVPNYVDWIWSVINCNGNCKSSSSGPNRKL